MIKINNDFLKEINSHLADTKANTGAAPSLTSLSDFDNRPGYIPVLDCRVAGTQFQTIPRYVFDMDLTNQTQLSGFMLDLRREPGNEYDANAISVETYPGVMLGYIPAKDNTVIAALMDHGQEFAAKLLKVERHNRTYLIDIRVYWVERYKKRKR